MFRYHPFPVYTKAIKPQPITCPISGQASDYSYSFETYPTNDDEAGEEQDVQICPWCLHNGAAARQYPDISFNDAPVTPDVDRAARDELAHRTPRYVSFQEQEWPVHHGDYSAFVGYVGWREIAAFAGELAGDLARLRRQLTWSKPDLESWVNGASVQGYLFRCTTCGGHQLTFDQD
jgi:uncharacterized protein CbrC (UPF0167 family)